MTTGQAGRSFGYLTRLGWHRRRRLKQGPIPFPITPAAMADAEIKFLNFNGISWREPRCGRLMAVEPWENPFLVTDAAYRPASPPRAMSVLGKGLGTSLLLRFFGFRFTTSSACILPIEHTNRNARSFLSACATAPHVPQDMDFVRNLKRTATQYRPHLPQN